MKSILRVFNRLMPFLPEDAQRFLKGYVVVSVVISLIDILALALLAIALSALAAGTTPSLPILGQLDTEGGLLVVLAACLLIVLKSVLSLLLTRTLTSRFADYELSIGRTLFDTYLRSPWYIRANHSTTDMIKISDTGVGSAIQGFLIPLAGIPLQLVTMISVFVVLFVAQPLTAIVAVLFFAGVAAFLYLVINRRVLGQARIFRDFNFVVSRLMYDMISALKELTLRGKLEEVAEEIDKNRHYVVNSRAKLYFLNQIPRFSVEISLVLGLLVVGATAYLIGGFSGAVGAIAFFGVAGLRIIPSLVAIQGSISSATSQLPLVERLINEIQDTRVEKVDAEVIGHEKLPEKISKLVLRDVTFQYPETTTPALNEVSLELPIGSSLAFVGQSGSGKSTLVDILLGLQLPTSGTILLDGLPLFDVLDSWRKRVGYVPQDVVLFAGSIAQNVALTWGEEYDSEKVINALKRAQLYEAIIDKYGSIEGEIGERGAGLSGGQKQRLGIARALYEEPLVLVMDEATSALDTKTEDEVTKAIAEIKGETTLVSVAHRLSTIRHYDQICFMRDSTIIATGTFEELIATQPEFRMQAALAGLTES